MIVCLVGLLSNFFVTVFFAVNLSVALKADFGDKCDFIFCDRFLWKQASTSESGPAGWTTVAIANFVYVWLMVVIYRETKEPMGGGRGDSEHGGGEEAAGGNPHNSLGIDESHEAL